MATETTAVNTGTNLEDIATGQRMIIGAIVLNIVAAGLRAYFGDIWSLLAVLGIVVAIVGLVKVTSGLGWSVGAKVAVFVLAVIPIVSILTLAIVSGRATRALKEGGYSVGLLGARRAPEPRSDTPDGQAG